eukprot:scaffold9007_cov112-Isochrysis_galbana.AAC.4
MRRRRRGSRCGAVIPAAWPSRGRCEAQGAQGRNPRWRWRLRGNLPRRRGSCEGKPGCGWVGSQGEQATTSQCSGTDWPRAEERGGRAAESVSAHALAKRKQQDRNGMARGSGASEVQATGAPRSKLGAHLLTAHTARSG